jgi:ferric-dicitrate binding protein FerR (iron transport regulator)
MRYTDRSGADELGLHDECLDAEFQASAIFVRKNLGAWTGRDEAALQNRLARDAAFAEEFGRVERVWEAIGRYAGASPELTALHRQAVVNARRARLGILPSAPPRERHQGATVATCIVLTVARCIRLSGRWLVHFFRRHP